MTGGRVLVLAIRAIGDMVLMTAVIRALHERLKPESLVVLADGPGAEIFAHHPHVDRVIRMDRAASRRLPWHARLRESAALIGRLRAERFTLAVDLFSGPRSAWLSWASGALRRIAEDRRARGRGLLYSDVVRIERNGRHLIEQKLALIEPLVGAVELKDATPIIRLTSEERRAAADRLQRVGLGSGRLAGIIPGGREHHLWPVERFARVADHVIQTSGAQVLLLGGDVDRPVCRDVAAAMRHRCVDLSGQTSLRELAALLERLALVIANETGPMHLAVATGQPQVIALY
ncbi:MAG TPA: glycosyltransferase family 9 protein, partial [Nitrospirales bacterium]|nr:glycosyltransferase family 9 protein [Nitrospirales bacterium]